MKKVTVRRSSSSQDFCVTMILEQEVYVELHDALEAAGSPLADELSAPDNFCPTCEEPSTAFGDGNPCPICNPAPMAAECRSSGQRS